MAIQNRRGLEADFDPNKMLPGEWAVSTDKKYVRMCFAAGICLRMATYEAFEVDMEQVKQILAETQDIQTAVQRIQSEVNDTAIEVENNAALAESYTHGGTGKREGEDTDNARYYMEEARDYAKQAKTFSGIHIASSEIAGVIKPGDNMVEEDGTFRQLKTVQGSSLILDNSYKGALRINKVYGKSTQDGVPTPEAPVPIVSVGDSGSIEINVYNAEMSENTKQSLTINTPNCLHGIPTTDVSVANYTDESGQMWICDERDWARGVDIKRIGRVVLDGDADWGAWEATTNFNNVFTVWVGDPNVQTVKPVNSGTDKPNILCNSYTAKTRGDLFSEEDGIGVDDIGALLIYDHNFSTDPTYIWRDHLTANPITVLYELATPIETPIPEEDMAAWRAMHSNELTTTILSDADVEVEYPTSRVGAVALDADMRSRENEKNIEELESSTTKTIDDLNNDISIHNFTAGETILDFAIANKDNRVMGFITQASIPSDSPTTEECFVIIERDSDGDRIMVRLKPYNGWIQWEYQRSIFGSEWREESWIKKEYLPLTGGTITGDLRIGDLRIGNVSRIQLDMGELCLINNSDEYGGNQVIFTVSGSREACFVGGYKIITTEDKPSGSYTGNGSATERVINCGGLFSPIAIGGNGYLTFVFPDSGAFSVELASGAVTGLRTSVHPISEGGFKIQTSDVSVNKSGVTYKYYVL